AVLAHVLLNLLSRPIQSSSWKQDPMNFRNRALGRFLSPILALLTSLTAPLAAADEPAKLRSAGGGIGHHGNAQFGGFVGRRTWSWSGCRSAPQRSPP